MCNHPKKVLFEDANKGDGWPVISSGDVERNFRINSSSTSVKIERHHFSMRHAYSRSFESESELGCTETWSEFWGERKTNFVVDIHWSIHRSEVVHRNTYVSTEIHVIRNAHSRDSSVDFLARPRSWMWCEAAIHNFAKSIRANCVFDFRCELSLHAAVSGLVNERIVTLVRVPRSRWTSQSCLYAYRKLASVPGCIEIVRHLTVMLLTNRRAISTSKYAAEWHKTQNCNCCFCRYCYPCCCCVAIHGDYAVISSTTNPCTCACNVGFTLQMESR